MRVALISDIHGNQLALEAVLEDIRVRGTDRIAFLGDAATLGPRPLEVLQTLRELQCPCIMGNHDEFLLRPELVEEYTAVPVITEAIQWCREQMSEADLQFVQSFKRTLEIPLSEDHSLLLFHGSPESHTIDLLATTPPDAFDGQLGSQRAAVMAGGHTHIQMLRQHRGVWVVNPGSVGMPFREYVSGTRPEIQAYAEYAVVEAGPRSIGVQLRRVELSREALRGEIASWRCPPTLLQQDMMLQYA